MILMNRIKLMFVFLLLAHFCFGQGYLLPNEEVVFSFKTKKGKKMVLAKDTENEYIVYRFGTEKKIEFEYPATKDKESWNHFTYYYYNRGGGIQNAGMELKSIFFRNGNFDYTIYYGYYSEDDSYETGVEVTDLTTNKNTDVKGNMKSLEDNFYSIFNNGLMKEAEDRIR